MDKKILQITGEPGAGKTDLSTYLSEKYGFVSVLVSDLIRGYALPRGIQLTERKDYRTAHALMLKDLGGSAITDAILSTPSDLVVVDGIRVPAHSQKLRLEHASKVIALHCPPDIRYKRTIERNKGIDKPSYEGFLRDDEEEAYNPDPYVQSTLTVMEAADYHIDSSKPFPEVTADVDEIVVPYLAA